MATIWERGPYQFRVRRKGVSETRTFETLREAGDWARVIEGADSSGRSNTALFG
jgi:hypothetical protein